MSDARWTELADAWTAYDWWRVEDAIDAWPTAERDRAIAWLAARIAEDDRGPRIAGKWLAVMLQDPDDPRVALVDGVDDDHDTWEPAHVASFVRRAPFLRVVSLAEVSVAPAIDALFDGIGWPRLEVLRIEECGALRGVVRALAAAPWTATLQELSLDDDADAIPDDAAAALVRSPHLRDLRVLSLGSVAGGGELVRAFAEAPIVDQLERIELSYVTDAGAIAAALDARKPRALRELAIRPARS